MNKNLKRIEATGLLASMSKNLKRPLAVGLLSLMIANSVACDKFGPTSNLPSTDTSHIGNNTTTSEVTNSSAHDSIYKPKDLPGDIWKALKANGEAYEFYHPNTDFEKVAMPIQFLIDEGLLYYNDNNVLDIADPKANKNKLKSLIHTNAYIDENTSENDVYLLVNYKTDIFDHEITEDVYVTTWKLKYTLDDADYQALLALEGDYRQRAFIRMMDNIEIDNEKKYEPEVISKCTSAQRFVAANSPFLNKYNVDNAFPQVYMESVDPVDYVITMGAELGDDEGYKSYEVHLYKSPAIDNYMKRYNVSREKALENIRVEFEDTILGPCLVKFHIDNFIATPTFSMLEDLYEQSTNEHKLKSLSTQSLENNFVAAK